MRGVWKKLAGFALVALLVTGGLVGCGLFAPKSAKDVFLRYAELSDRDNFVAKGTVGATLSIMGQDVPLTFNVQADVMGEAVHTTTTYKLFGEEIASESYLEKSGDDYVLYSAAGTGDDAVWTKSTVNTKNKSTGKGDGESDNGNTMDPLSALFLAQKVLDSSEFVASDTGYTVTVPGSVLLEVINTTDELKNMLKDVDEQTLKNVLNDAQIVFDFDKDCRLNHLSLTMSMDIASTEQSDDIFSFDMSLAVSADLDLGEYGSVTEETVTVPNSVKEKATNIDDAAESLGDIFGMNELTKAA